MNQILICYKTLLYLWVSEGPSIQSLGDYFFFCIELNKLQFLTEW